MFQSLDEAIILVNKDKLEFQNNQYEELMSQLEVQKGLSLDPKFFEVWDETRDLQEDDKGSISNSKLSINDILKKEVNFAKDKTFIITIGQKNGQRKKKYV